MGLMDSIGNGLAGMTAPSGSSLKGFLSKFNSSEGLYVNQIDTLHTFDTKFYFYPCKSNFTAKGGWDAVGDNLKNMASGAVKNALNNVTGGLLGAAMNDGNVLDEKTYDPKMSFIEYLSRGNMLNGSGDWVGGAPDPVNDQLVLDLTYYIQNIQLPQISMKEEGNIETMVGEFPVNGRYVKPSQNTFQMEIINTKAPLVERIFYPWMREVTLPFWVYEDQPYSTADVEISFEKHSDNKYLFVGCRPSQIEALRPSNDLNTPVRNVTMTFDYMFILSNLDRSGSFGDALLDAGKSLIGGGASMLGL